MTASLARSAGHHRAVASGLAVLVSATAMLLGGSASATEPDATTNAAPRVQCTVDLSTRPVRVQPGEQVQLALNLAGVWLNIGQPQTVGDDPGEQVLSATITGVVGLVGQLCSAVVQVDQTVREVAPLPDASVPDLPLPEQDASVPVPGADVSVRTGQDASSPSPGTPVPAPNPQTPPDPDADADVPQSPPRGVDWRFDHTRFPLYDFAGMPSLSTRFGDQAAPAFRYGQQLPGYAPRFGILDDEAADDADLANAGTARALPLSPGGEVTLPVLIAVLMLSVVTGALVRTWVLRNAT